MFNIGVNRKVLKEDKIGIGGLLVYITSCSTAHVVCRKRLRHVLLFPKLLWLKSKKICTFYGIVSTRYPFQTSKTSLVAGCQKKGHFISGKPWLTDKLTLLTNAATANNNNGNWSSFKGPESLSVARLLAPSIDHHCMSKHSFPLQFKS